MMRTVESRPIQTGEMVRERTVAGCIARCESGGFTVANGNEHGVLDSRSSVIWSYVRRKA
jgi:hypothetical protein